MQTTVKVSDNEHATWGAIADYYGCSKAEVFRTMLRYFEIHLGLGTRPRDG